jgi:hypothetical protein
MRNAKYEIAKYEIRNAKYETRSAKYVALFSVIRKKEPVKTGHHNGCGIGDLALSSRLWLCRNR